MSLHAEKQAGPRRRIPTAVKTALSRCQTERAGKECWDAEQLDRDAASCWRVRIASEPLGPREARVSALRTGQDHLRWVWRSGGWRLTLLTQRTEATPANARRIHDMQTPMGLWAPLLGGKRLPCWTAECPVGLERKVSSGEAPRFPGRGRARWSVSRWRSG